MTRRAKALPPLADETAGYIDLFDDSNKRRHPLILTNGTDVLFPKGWSEKDAASWRAGIKLERPIPPPRAR
jgi:hypothetical protein